MASATLVPRNVPVPAELMVWAMRLRAGVIIGLYALAMAGRSFAHLPIAPLPAVLIALGAAIYNGILAAVVWYTREWPGPAGDRIRVRILYMGGLLDAVAMACVVLFTGGLLSPWLYFFLATSVVSNTILPPTAGRVITAFNAAAATAVVVISSGSETGPMTATPGLNFWTQPSYAVIVGVSLVGMLCLTAYAVNVPVENARSAAWFQEGLAQIALVLQRSASNEQALQALCSHTHQWFDVSRTVIMLLEGEELVARAATGLDSAAALGRRIPVSDPHSPEVEVLRRHAGFYRNALSRSLSGDTPLAKENGERPILLVPLLGTLGVLGVLTMAHRNPRRRFTPTQLQQASIIAAQAGAAIENTRLLERVREEADSVTALLTALEVLTKSHDLPTLLTDLNRIAADMASCSRSATFLWDPQRHVFYFGSAFGHSAEFTGAMRGLELPRGRLPLMERALAGESFVLSPEQVRDFLPYKLDEGTPVGPSAVIPLVTEQAVQGIMSVSHINPAADFTHEQLWTLRGVARYAALAIERARLMDQEREAAATAEVLVALGRDLSATLDRSQVLSRVPEIAAVAARCDFAVLGFWDRRTQKAEILGTYGFPPEATRHLLELSVTAPSIAMTNDLARMGHFEIQSPQPLPGLPPGLMERFHVSRLLGCVFGPIEQRIGCLAVGDRERTGPFSAAQKRLLDGIVRQATVVFENTRLVENLRRANQLKSDFLSTVSHELRTPLNAIIGYTDLLRERALGPLLPEQIEVADIVAKKGVQLLELINTTLDLTQLEAGQVGVNVSEFSLAELLQEVKQDLVDEVPPLVEFGVSAATLPVMRTDRLKLKTVIRNLTHNALKFTQRGAVNLRAECGSDPSRIHIVVEDTGIGIATEDVQAIFEMFRQLEPALTRRFGGVGLGLYIVQRLLDLLQGEIRVHSEPGHGSVFTVIVPVRLQ